jgi:CheY-like chemotaxis protein
MEAYMFIANVSQSIDPAVEFNNQPREVYVSRNSGNILVVDADRNVLKQLSQSFAICAKHYNILTASNGLEAVEILKSFQIDILLTDFHMAGVSGYSLIDLTKLYYPTAQIFVMSEGDSSDIKNKLSDLGISGYISKPYRIEMIYSVLRI